MKKIFTVAALIALLTLGSSGKTFAAANPFPDVPEGHWAYNAVVSLASEGIASSYDDGTFRGNRNTTRYETAIMLNNFWNKYFGSQRTGNNRFSDVSPDNVAYEAVTNLANLGIVTGYDDGTFKGDRNITRYELATALANFLIRANKISNINAVSTFHDISKNHPNYQGVAIVESEKIMDGYGDGTFRGNRNITRYEVALILAKINAKYFR